STALEKAGYRWSQSLSPEFAVAGDMNPGTPELLTVGWNSPAAAQRAQNSYNHVQDGQNILFGDGHVEFAQNAFVGFKRDNIYTAGPSGGHADTDAASPGGVQIGGPPLHANDSVLLPVQTLPPPANLPTPVDSQLLILVGGTVLLLVVGVGALLWALLRTKTPPSDPPSQYPSQPPPLPGQA